ncbi:MAG: (d)CMP kinase [Candidatus Bilamarchaeum sp.]|jgi:cytidylate kinase
MIIAIAGLTGCGKNTLGELLANELGYKLVCPTFKDLALKEGISLMEFQKKAEKDPDIDKKFDALLKEQADKECVVTTWLGPWMVNADLRVKLFTPDIIRAKRVATRDKISEAAALKAMKERDEQNRNRYLKLYNIDIYSDDVFDVKINSGIYSPDELLKIVLDIIRVKKAKKNLRK